MYDLKYRVGVRHSSRVMCDAVLDYEAMRLISEDAVDITTLPAVYPSPTDIDVSTLNRLYIPSIYFFS